MAGGTLGTTCNANWRVYAIPVVLLLITKSAL
jgi:hypothetical protein